MRKAPTIQVLNLQYDCRCPGKHNDSKRENRKMLLSPHFFAQLISSVLVKMDHYPESESFQEIAVSSNPLISNRKYKITLVIDELK